MENCWNWEMKYGVYDGKHCVGALAVTNNWPMGFWAWMDESETEYTDGYITGNNMSFQIWDASSNQKFTAVPTYIKGDGIHCPKSPSPTASSCLMLMAITKGRF